MEIIRNIAVSTVYIAGFISAYGIYKALWDATGKK